MSRSNKVNPGMYTQRGRLTQDDAARELRKQRAVGSEHTWQPSKKDHFPRLASTNNDAALGAETSGDKDTEDAKTSTVQAKPASRVSRSTPSAKAAPAKAKAKQPAAKSKPAKKTAAKATKGKVAKKTAKPAAKRSASGRAATTTARKAVLARNVGGLRLRSGQPRAESRGGGGSKPRAAAKRRKS